jgi:uncharacterized protein (TIGR02001 family)
VFTADRSDPIIQTKIDHTRGYFMRRLILAAALAGLAAPAAATSLSATFSGVSDYTFDGVSLNNDDPTLQASLDLGFESGFYLGVWGSGVDFGDDGASAEIDFYGGYAGETEGGWGYDYGFAHYTYVDAPSDGFDYTEIYGGVTFPVGTNITIWYTDDDDVFGGTAMRGKVTHSFELMESLSLDLEATRTQIEDPNFDDFNHFQIGVTKTLGSFEGYLGYSDTSLDDNPRADGRVLFSISTTIEFF